MRLLLVVVGDASPETIRLALGVAPQQVHVVAPTVVSPLDWLANADDAGRARAEARARAAEKALHGLVAVIVLGDFHAGFPQQRKTVVDAVPAFEEKHRETVGRE